MYKCWRNICWAGTLLLIAICGYYLKLAHPPQGTVKSPLISSGATPSQQVHASRNPHSDADTMREPAGQGDNWADEMRALRDQELTIKVERLEKARSELHDLLNEFTRSQQVFHDAAARGEPVDPKEAEQAVRREETLVPEINRMQNHVYHLSREVTDRFVDLRTKEFGLSLPWKGNQANG